MADRLRGSAGVKQRLRRLHAEPLCRRCASRGRTTAAVVPDHIKALALGGTDDDSNIQCLCRPCHDEKTRDEFNQRAAPSSVDALGWPIVAEATGGQKY